MKYYIEKVLERQDLSVREAAEALALIMTNQATEIQIAGFLVALRAKGECEDELVGFATTMRDRCIKIKTDDPDAIDMCGTGGDGHNTFNVSTVAALVVAGAGVTVAKHGNRSVSSRSGSADVLGALGVNIQIAPERVEACVNSVGIGFLFAPLLHPAMKYAARPRQELGIRTIFNMLGPITNPAGVRRQVLGTYHPDAAIKLAGALSAMNTELACVVHDEDGMDEVSLSSQTSVYEVQHSTPVRQYSVTPQEFGLNPTPRDAIRGGDPTRNADIALRILQGEHSPGRDVVLANAAMGIRVAGRTADLKEASALAAESIDSGRTLSVLRHLVEFTNKP